MPKKTANPKIEKLEVRYVDLNEIARWKSNPKRHDIGAIITSIKTYGFKDPPKFEPSLNRGKGGLVEGNGRDEALLWMFKDDPNNPPRGVVNNEGRWLIPVLFGVDADSQAAAEAYAIDHNNLTMGGGDFTVYDIARMWDVDLYNETLQQLAKDGTYAASMDAQDVRLLDAALKGLLIPLPSSSTDGEARKTKITLVLDASEVIRLEKIVAAVREFIKKNGWKVEVAA